MSLIHLMLNPNLSQEFIAEQMNLQSEHVKRLCDTVETYAKTIKDPIECMEYVASMMPLLIQQAFM